MAHQGLGARLETEMHELQTELEGEEDIKKSEAQTYVFHAMKTNYKIRMHYHNCLYLCFKEFAVF